RQRPERPLDHPLHRAFALRLSLPALEAAAVELQSEPQSPRRLRLLLWIWSTVDHRFEGTLRRYQPQLPGAAPVTALLVFRPLVRPLTRPSHGAKAVPLNANRK